MTKPFAVLAAASLAGSALAAQPFEVTAPGPEGELAGTLIAPGEGRPTVLIVPGSGPTDRDGNNPLGVASASYRLLAEALAERGIGSLRIDKRGMFASKGAIPDANDVTIAGYADDVAAWVRLARERTGAQCIFVLGHSEGGLVALEAARAMAGEDGGLCGVMLVASLGRPFSQTLREQLAANLANAPVLEDAYAALDALERGERVDVSALHPGLQRLLAPQVQGFLIDMMARDPAAMAAGVDLPMLIVAGGKDIQTPLADAEALAAGQPKAELVVIEDMNHVLKAVPGEGRAANLAAYGDPSLPVHPRLVAAIADFVSAD